MNHGSPAKLIVFDIGGTKLRSAIYDVSSASLSHRIETPSPSLPTVNSLSSFNASPEDIPFTLVHEICQRVNHYIELLPEYELKHVGVSIAGPVDPNGVILESPPLWGQTVQNYPLRSILQTQLRGITVEVINDVSAAGWRYLDSFNGTFCIFSIGTGLGCKVFWNKEVLLNNKGLGGEIGHLHYPEYHHILCDCGRPGHTSSIASGTGLVKLTNYLLETKQLDTSAVNLHINNFNGYELTQEILQNPYAELILSESIKPITQAISNLYAFIGIERYIFIGGVINAFREKYTNILIEQLQSNLPWGISPEDIKNWIVLGQSDDDHGLIGMGRYLAQKHKTGAQPCSIRSII